MDQRGAYSDSVPRWDGPAGPVGWSKDSLMVSVALNPKHPLSSLVMTMFPQ